MQNTVYAKFEFNTLWQMIRYHHVSKKEKDRIFPSICPTLPHVRIYPHLDLPPDLLCLKVKRR